MGIAGSCDMGEPVLVTGGAGFVGSHLVDRLLDRGDHVRVLDNFETGSIPNIAHRMAHPRFRLQRHDVETPLTVVPTVRVIYHLAACASPVQYQRDPVKTTTTNVIGTRNMLEIAQRTGARLVLASTSEVYGDPAVHPQTEDYRGDVNPIGPRACYDEGKRCAETLAFAYASSRGVAIRVARIFNTYGPRMACDDGRVVSNLIVQALRGEPMTVYGDGRQTRSFCYVSDLVDGLIRLAHADTEGPVNLGNPGEVPMIELAQHIRELTGSQSEIVFKPLPVDDPRRRCPSIERAKKLLSWSPTVQLRDGLAATVDYFRRVLHLTDRETATA
jgi:UDP-glucuronate decarboxylase